jgi:glyoxylase-like metal-dependent hydrolase (beta-lactamase superfamily II)
LLIAVAVFLVAIVALCIRFRALFSMKSVMSGYIENTGVLAIKSGMNNLYAINSSEGYIFIDGGSSAKAIEQVLQKENIPAESVRHIFLTHSDSDHTAAASLFPGAAIYMGENELQMVNGEITKGKNNSNSSLHNKGIENIVLLGDNQEIIIGGRTIKCLKMPGHTTGSMIYIVDGDYLFSGDCFMVAGNKIGVHPFTRDAKLAQESINSLYETLIKTNFTFTSHYGYFPSKDLTVN